MISENRQEDTCEHHDVITNDQRKGIENNTKYVSNELSFVLSISTNQIEVFISICHDFRFTSTNTSSKYCLTSSSSSEEPTPVSASIASCCLDASLSTVR